MGKRKKFQFSIMKCEKVDPLLVIANKNNATAMGLILMTDDGLCNSKFTTDKCSGVSMWT